MLFEKTETEKQTALSWGKENYLNRNNSQRCKLKYLKFNLNKLLKRKQRSNVLSILSGAQ